jgi:HSP20 family protein
MTTVQMYDPFAETGFDELFRGFFRPVRGDKNAPAAIRIDVTESDNAYTVHAEVPGVKKDEIHVAIEGNQVSIAAEVKREVDAGESGRVLRTERYFGGMYRSFMLPAEIDEANSTAKYDNGILELKLAKKPAVAGRKLAVQ